MKATGSPGGMIGVYAEARRLRRRAIRFSLVAAVAAVGSYVAFPGGASIGGVACMLVAAYATVAAIKAGIGARVHFSFDPSKPEYRSFFFGP